MKLCVTSSGQGLEAKVGDSFDRAAFFNLVDLDTMRCRSLRNLPALPGETGGKTAAALVSLLEVDGVLTGEIGDYAIHALQEAGIRVFAGARGNDSVAEAVAKFQRGTYQEAALDNEHYL